MKKFFYWRRRASETKSFLLFVSEPRSQKGRNAPSLLASPTRRAAEEVGGSCSAVNTLYLLPVFALLVAGCTLGQPTVNQDQPAVPTNQAAQTPPAPTNEAAMTNIFTATTVAIGDKIGAMTLAAINGKKFEFTGTVTLTGDYYYVPEGDGIIANEYCFNNIESASANQLPHLNGDGRSLWFCFTNKDQAQQSLGTGKGKATIVISQYVVNSLEASVWNTAVLASVTNKSVTQAAVDSNTFSAATVAIGDTVGAMTLAAINGKKFEFTGTVTLTGDYYYTPTGGIISNEYCFNNVESAAANQLPHLSGDGRNLWFCFTNKDRAQQLLGTGKGTATVTISQYVVNSLEGEAWNTAVLVSVAK